VQSLREHEAGRRLVDAPGIGGAARDHRPLLDRTPQLPVIGDDRQQFGRSHTAAATGFTREHQAHARAHVALDLRKAFDVVEIGGAREPALPEHERAAPTEEHIGRAHGVDEFRVGVVGARGAREQPEHHATTEPGNQRHAQPGGPAPA
jgi:hypothetical protein